MILLVSCGAWAGPKLIVEKKGSYVYWFTYSDAAGNEGITLPLQFKGKDVEIDDRALSVGVKSVKLYVMNKKTGNTAIYDYILAKDSKKPQSIKLSEEDFEYVRNVALTIVAEDGAPLERAVVIITDGLNTRMKTVITPADEGVARFQNVATGEINVKVEADGLKKTIDSDFNLPARRDTPSFARSIRVSGDVDTIEVKKAKENKEASAKTETKETSDSGGFGAILQLLVGFIFIAIIIAIVYSIVRAKGISAQEVLKKMGVPVSEDQVGASATTPVPQADPNICQFCGSRKDANGNCPCTVAPGSVPSTGSAAATAGPRLIGVQGVYAGRILNVPAGTAVIGREPSCQVALVDDSTVSRKHASITSSGSEYIIKDEGSSNGTFVNGAKITEQKLTPGDEVQIGGSKFRFEV